MSRFLFACLMIFPASSLAEQQKKVVLSSFSIIADMTQNVAKDLVTVISLVPPGTDAHTYQATPSDAIKIQKADIVLCNGLNLEGSFIKYFTNRENTRVITVSDGVKPISVSDKSDGSDPNPHAWMSVKNAMIYIQNIRKALEEIDPEHAAEYERNAKAYEEEIVRTILPFKSKIDSIDPNNRWLVTSEGCMVYLAEYFGLKSLYLWPITSDSERSPSQIREVIKQMRKHKIKFIFSESTNSDQPAKQVAYEAKASYGGVLYVDTLSKPEGPAPTYLKLLTITLKTITDRLTT
ncbi:MAG: metal ABC transporter substrate-binding protein [Candidatus Liberibacter europaeus]|uniref:Metal ABC transporter substrate-binding protein n=1 Tax=Candidatus Liberibacter europaeus TaxID=744859 RepID=A0A2T4VXJ7_9HYPH|nr:metal ABC transporter substrate-binding protein [Candidatus Liberibacter europaeus]PTL86488.1 MAG: metal ABC transporter substrate-binding protein [Candidatus Liberibacter europaeus]